jgi:hypothetical protein
VDHTTTGRYNPLHFPLWYAEYSCKTLPTLGKEHVPRPEDKEMSKTYMSLSSCHFFLSAYFFDKVGLNAMRK